jgi:acyl-[acyl carrier protein]--UDP-N-acetylglucosamine O-acyltransferase
MIHQSAVIGDPPESREYWRDPSLPTHPPHIHPTARVHAFVTVDSGLKRPTTIGERTALMAHVHVGHDVLIGKDCELAPGAKIGGHCEIGDGVRIGINATLRPFIKVGDGARIGCGAVVIRDVPAGEVWAGNPAKQIRQRTDAERQRDQELDMVAELEWERIADSVGKPSEAYQ